MSRILIISTAHDTLGDSGNKTGVWLEELAAPYYKLKDAGHDVTVASIGGAQIPVDPNSEPQGEDAAASAKRFKNDADAMAVLENPANLTECGPIDFDAVFIPGGHGAVWDLAESPEVSKFLEAIWTQGKPIASVCHGPAAFVGVEVDGKPLVAGRKVSAFTDSEETATGLETVVPFLLESRLRRLGADMQIGPDMQPMAVADGKLITGQNPMSSDRVADLLLEQVA